LEGKKRKTTFSIDGGGFMKIKKLYSTYIKAVLTSLVMNALSGSSTMGDSVPS
jgi:hypothetical protein